MTAKLSETNATGM